MEDNDVGSTEYWRDLKQARQEKRADNRENSAEYLAQREIPFVSKNGGAHLIVKGGEGFIDFWPGTGKWHSRCGKKGFGVRNLVAFIDLLVRPLVNGAKETTMTKDDFMALVTRYTEACDDMGAGLFEQTQQQTAAKHKAATDLWQQISAEVDRLHREAAKSERRAIVFGDIVHTQVLAMRAAVVDAKLNGPEAGMAWIKNTLEGPGQLPDVAAAKAEGGAQCMFNRELAEHEAFRAAHPAP